MIELEESTVYDTINDIEDIDKTDELPPVSEMSIEEIMGSDIGTFLAIREQIAKEKKRQKQIKTLLRQKQIDIRKNKIFNEELNILSTLKEETNKLQKELDSINDVEEIIDSDIETTKNM